MIDHRVSIAAYTIQQSHQLGLAMLLRHHNLSCGHQCEWQNQVIDSMCLLELIACDFPEIKNGKLFDGFDRIMDE